MSCDPYSPMKLKDPVARFPAIPKAKHDLQFAPIKFTDPAAWLLTILHDPTVFADPAVLFQELFQALQFTPNHIFRGITGAGGVTFTDDSAGELDHIHVEEINANNEIRNGETTERVLKWKPLVFIETLYI
ncbi:hypothetical protein DFJ73DRAFT_756577 [Zopfochytrium polystomum]|nr:hypothetical protein DFJ73DRAFT_756577 [Zopfochytrium polystomum]